ncbi:uncharacterized protein G2W53_036543 [Senna tora]|uniref:Uncharacterized protein n=1 Tax=Senna tora TaxID=362788 RepID=A0A834ST25_9FABA|nr:uncharacterized protein G2W53_036543 [Senna tora]
METRRREEPEEIDAKNGRTHDGGRVDGWWSAASC